MGRSPWACGPPAGAVRRTGARRAPGASTLPRGVAQRDAGLAGRTGPADQHRAQPESRAPRCCSLFYARMSRRLRPTLPYDIDGVVYKGGLPARAESAGSLARARASPWRTSIPPRKPITTLLDIEVQVGRTGAITPVARLQPVFVGGVTVTNATPCTTRTRSAEDVRIGDTVVVRRAGDVIPEVVGPVLEKAARGRGGFRHEEKYRCVRCAVPRSSGREGEAIARCNRRLVLRRAAQARRCCTRPVASASGYRGPG